MSNHLLLLAGLSGVGALCLAYCVLALHASSPMERAARLFQAILMVLIGAGVTYACALEVQLPV